MKAIEHFHVVLFIIRLTKSYTITFGNHSEYFFSEFSCFLFIQTGWYEENKPRTVILLSLITNDHKEHRFYTRQGCHRPGNAQDKIIQSQRKVSDFFSCIREKLHSEEQSGKLKHNTADLESLWSQRCQFAVTRNLLRTHQSKMNGWKEQL